MHCYLKSSDSEPRSFQHERGRRPKGRMSEPNPLCQTNSSLGLVWLAESSMGTPAPEDDDVLMPFTTRMRIPIVGYAIYVREARRRDPDAKSSGHWIVTAISLLLGLVFVGVGALFPTSTSILLTVGVVAFIIILFSIATRTDLWLQSGRTPRQIQKWFGWLQLSGLTTAARQREFTIVNYHEAWMFSLAIVLGLVIGIILV